jgi:hypothetical protein
MIPNPALGDTPPGIWLGTANGVVILMLYFTVSALRVVMPLMRITIGTVVRAHTLFCPLAVLMPSLDTDMHFS